MQIVTPKYTPEIGPIDHDTSQIILTPITSGLICQQMEDIMQDFMLDGGNSSIFQTKSQSKRRKIKKNLFKDNLALSMFKLDCDLEKIIEYEDEQSYYSSNESFIDEQSFSQFDDDRCLANSNTLMTVWSTSLKSKDSHTLDIEDEKQTTFDINVDYTEKIERYSKNPKMEIIKKIKEIQMLTLEIDQQQKMLLIKTNLEKYLLDCQVFCFEQSWKQLGSFKNIISLIIAGIQETFAKKIGNLSFQSRRIKLLKYLQKKKKRIWRKKVSYDCRKKVADGRLRIKGKFVTREQACQQLGVQNLDNYNAEQIKEMLEKKIDDSSVNLSTLSHERDSRNI